ncbi:MAG: phosphate-starvation-inducible PsiE family protein [Methylovulum sp.]|nr:phosphate-starvation-inducible PsiE family protein [Methylovulum sp.]
MRCLIFIAITALSRLLIADIQMHHQAETNILLLSGSILVLGLATRLIGKSEDKV